MVTPEQSPSGRNEALQFEGYCTRLLKELEIPFAGEYHSTTDLYDEVGMDSLNALELLIITEGFANLMVPLPEIPPIFTLGDAYEYYLIAFERSEESSIM
jgi:hypothetical protein